MDSHHHDPPLREHEIVAEAPTVRRGTDASKGEASKEESSSSPATPNVTSDLEGARTVIRHPGGSSASAVSDASSKIIAAPAEVAGVLLGQELNHFRLEQLIGGGGMGAVFKARDTRLDRIVAIKVIPRVGEDPDLLRRFRNEAQSAARLDHRNIARVYDVGRFEEWHYIVFEYIEGINLRDLVARDGVLSIDDAVFFTRQVVEAIQHADQRGVVHRDIKPSNVLVRADGQVKLVDMGLARSLQLEVSGDMTASGVTLGTFDYISPEQARDPRDADVRSDIYSLGCTLFFVLTGRPPFPGGTVLQKLLSHGNAPPPDPREFRPEVSDNLAAILQKMLAKRPSDRYGKPIDLIADLSELAVRENLSRAQSVGMVAVASSSRWVALVERHLPWAVAALLLIVSVAWLQLLSSIDNVDATIPVPPDAVASTEQPAPSDRANVPATGRSPSAETQEQASTIPAAEDAAVRDPAVETAADEPEAAPAVPDVSQQPPTFTLPQPFEFDAVSGEAESDDGLQSPLQVAQFQRIQVGGSTADLPKTTLAAAGLSEAIKLARVNKISRIELAESVTCNEPLVIRQDELVIGAAVDGVEIRFAQMPLQAMQNAVMIDVADSRVRFEDLRFHWDVPPGAVNGGALFSLTANRRMELVDCAITIANPSPLEAIYAFDIATDQPAGSIGAAEGSMGPPLVVISLTNVIARGEMTLIHMDVAAQLQFKWDNGFLGISRRLLETGGAVARPPVGMTQLKIVMDHVTASAQMGLVLVSLGPSGSVPVMIDRELTNCAITTEMGSPHVEIRGLEDAESAGQYVGFRGVGNHYDNLPGRSDQMLWATDTEGGSQLFRLSDLVGRNRPGWMEERSPQSVIYWSQPAPPPKPASLLLPSDFQQDGNTLPGFIEAELPRLDPAPAEPAPI